MRFNYQQAIQDGVSMDQILAHLQSSNYDNKDEAMSFLQQQNQNLTSSDFDTTKKNFLGIYNSITDLDKKNAVAEGYKKLTGQDLLPKPENQITFPQGKGSTQPTSIVQLLSEQKGLATGQAINPIQKQFQDLWLNEPSPKIRKEYEERFKGAFEYSIFGEPKKEETKDTKKEDAGSAIDLLESIYLGSKEEMPLSFGTAGLGGRLGGKLKGIQTGIAPGTYPESERLNTYKRTLESIRPQLAKAAEDAGNIALMEQIMAGRGLPDEESLPGEAVALFKSMRAKFGLEQSKALSEFEETRLPEITQKREDSRGLGGAITDIGGGLANLLFGNILKLPQTLPQSVQIQKETAPKTLGEALNPFRAISGYLQSLKPVAPAAMELGLTAPALSGILSGSTARSVGKIGGKITSPFRAKPPTVTPESLLKGIQTANEAKISRSAVIKTAQETGNKVTGSNIFRKIEEWAVRAKRANPTESKMVDKFVTGAKSQLKGKNLNPQTAKDLWDDADRGFSAAGLKGSSLEASYHRIVRDSLRKELDKIAPGFEKLTKTIKSGLDLEKLLKPVRTGAERKAVRTGLESTPAPVTEFLKKTGGRVAGGAAAGGGLYLIAKMLGLDIPGMFREQQY